MASAVEQQGSIFYTLFGSCSDVSCRRRVPFLEPLPRSQYLEKCVWPRLRAQLMELLSCSHSVIAWCYAECVLRKHASALDTESFGEYDFAVGRSEDCVFGHTRCWNVGGCDTPGPTFVVLD